MESGGTKQDYDLTFPNICVQGEIWTMIDYEWTTDKLTPQQIISRALNCYGQEDPVRLEHPIDKASGSPGHRQRADAGAQKKRTGVPAFCPAGKGRPEPDGLHEASASDRQPGLCAVSGIFARADRKVRYLKISAQAIRRSILIINMMHGEADDLINARIILQAGTKAIRLDPAELPCLVQIRWNRMARKNADAGTAGSVPVDERTGACRYPVPCSGRYCLKQEIRTSAFRLDCLDNEATDGEALIIRAQIAWLSAEMLQDSSGVPGGSGKEERFLVSKIKEAIQNI